jgi:hypothetical protein
MAMALQSVYLAEVGRPFAAALFGFIDGEANQATDAMKKSIARNSRLDVLGISRQHSHTLAE